MTSRNSTLSKTDVRYWKSRLRKRTTDNWEAQIAFAGQRQRFPLGTPNSDAAAGKAREIYLSLHRDGWEKTLATYKPWTAKAEQRTEFPTVGEFLQQVQAVSDLKPGTFAIYARKFRRLVAGVAGIVGTKERFDYVNGGHQHWRQKVDGVRLAALTQEKIQGWKVEFLKKASGNPLLQRRAVSTVASLIRSGKALFAKGVTQHLSLRLPTPLPFDGIMAGGTGNHRYKSEINAGIVLQQANRDLRASEPELFKIVLLAIATGLRRDEIDTLTWKQIDWNRHVIRVETNEYTKAKSEGSEAEIDADPELLDFFKGEFATSQSEFVISSGIAPRPHISTYHHYRCNRLFKKVNAWLRGKGVTSRNPLHVLRKEFGSLICAQAGIFAASVALRHKNINLTRDYYVDKKHPIRLAIGQLVDLGPQKGTTEFSEAGTSAQAE